MLVYINVILFTFFCLKFSAITLDSGTVYTENRALFKSNATSSLKPSILN